MAKLSEENINNILQDASKKAKTNPLADVNVSLEEVDSFGDNASLKGMFTDIAKYNEMLAQKITFINSGITDSIPFTRENLYLMCAYSGHGKSTIAANISYPLWKEGKKVLVISNEESRHDVLFRIACLELGYNFNDYKKGKMAMETQREVAKLFPEISKFVKVIDITHKDGITTKLEGVKNLLKAVQAADYSCALIDYYQLIQYSVEDKTRSRYEVLNDLRIWLGQYIKQSNIPVVMFAQLHSMGKRQNKDLDSRVKECPSIIEPATVVIEVVPDMENKTTMFLIHKDRFGLQGNKIDCAFENGRFVNMTPEQIRKMAERKLTELKDKIEEEREVVDDQLQVLP